MLYGQELSQAVVAGVGNGEVDPRLHAAARNKTMQALELWRRNFVGRIVTATYEPSPDEHIAVTSQHSAQVSIEQTLADHTSHAYNFAFGGLEHDLIATTTPEDGERAPMAGNALDWHGRLAEFLRVCVATEAKERTATP